MVRLEYISIWLASILSNITQGLGRRRSKNIALGGETWRGRKWVTANVLSLDEKLVFFFSLNLKFNNPGTNGESAYNMTAVNWCQGHCYAWRSQHIAAEITKMTKQAAWFIHTADSFGIVCTSLERKIRPWENFISKLHRSSPIKEVPFEESTPLVPIHTQKWNKGFSYHKSHMCLKLRDWKPWKKTSGNNPTYPLFSQK